MKIKYDPECEYCKKYNKPPPAIVMCPSHEASERCQSGKRNHCTCDTCF